MIATHAQGPADTAEVSIVEPAPQVTRVTVSPETTTLNVGTTAQLTAQAFDGSGTELTDVTFAWTSTDQGIATVSSSGLVTAKAVGSALVIAAAAGVADTASVTIESVSSIPTTPGSGIWIGPEQISQLPTSGVAWDAVLADAERDFGIADISDQDSKHDNYTLAAALVCARTGE